MPLMGRRVQWCAHSSTLKCTLASQRWANISMHFHTYRSKGCDCYNVFLTVAIGGHAELPGPMNSLPLLIILAFTPLCVSHPPSLYALRANPSVPLSPRRNSQPVASTFTKSMPPKSQSAKRTASKTKAKERKEKKLLEERKRDAMAKCEEARSFLEPAKKNAEPNFTKAKIALDAAQELHDSDPYLFYLLGECHRGQEQYVDAIAQYTKALDMDPHYLRALDSRAACYQAQGDLKHAVEDYTSYIGMDAENDHAYNMRGLCILNGRVPGLRLKSTDFNDCVKNFTRAIELNDANYYAWANLGKAHEDQGNLSRARACYTSSLGIKTDYAYARFRRGCVTLMLAEEILHELDAEENESSIVIPISTALAAPQGLTSSKPQEMTLRDVEEEVRRNTVREEQERLAQTHLNDAERDLQELVDCNPDANRLLRDPNIALNLGVCSLLRRQLKKAEDYFKEADEIIAARPGLVESGEAEAIGNAALLKDVLAMRHEEVKSRRLEQTS